MLTPGPGSASHRSVATAATGPALQTSSHHGLVMAIDSNGHREDWGTMGPTEAIIVFYSTNPHLELLQKLDLCSVAVVGCKL